MRKMLKGDFCHQGKINLAPQREASCVTLCSSGTLQHHEEQDILNSQTVMVTDDTERRRLEGR